MSETKFSRGMQVICIATDDYHSDRMPIGSVFTITEVYGTGWGQCLSFAEIEHSPYSRKFIPWEGMVEPDMDLEEIHAFQDLVNGGCK